MALSIFTLLCNQSWNLQKMSKIWDKKIQGHVGTSSVVMGDKTSPAHLTNSKTADTTRTQSNVKIKLRNYIHLNIYTYFPKHKTTENQCSESQQIMLFAFISQCTLFVHLGGFLSIKITKITRITMKTKTNVSNSSAGTDALFSRCFLIYKLSL